MARHISTDVRCRWLRLVLGTGILAAFLIGSPLTADDGDKSSAKPPTRTPPKDAGAVEVRFTDSSTLRLSLREERIEITTRYGKLQVPVGDIQKIDFATRIPDDVAAKIETAIANLGSPKYNLRETAQADLLALREKAYPALVRATKHKDPEVIRRAEELVNALRLSVPEDQLEAREFDVMHAGDMKVTGRISEVAFKVSTSQFGEQPLKLADLRSLRSLTYAAQEAEADPRNVIADAGNLTQYQNQIGKVLYIRVNAGAANAAAVARGGLVAGPGGVIFGGFGGGNTVWGTDVYTTDSHLATAAIHAGAVRPGQTAVVKVTIVPSPNNFTGSTKNGVTTNPYDQYPAAFTVTALGAGRGARP